MHITPPLYGASQLHVHASAILSIPGFYPLRYLRLTEENLIEVSFAKLTRDLEKRNVFFCTFNLASLRRTNSGEAIISRTAIAFSRTLKNLAKTLTVEGVTRFLLAAAPYRAPGQETEGFVAFYLPTLDLNGEGAPAKLFATHRTLHDISVRMVGLPPQLPSESSLGSSRVLSVARDASFITPSTETEKTSARIHADIFNLDVSDISAGENFFGLGGTSVDVIRPEREGESAFQLAEIPTIQILKHPVVSSLAKYVDSLASKDASTEEYGPIVILNLTGNKTPIFMVHPGVGEVLIFVNLAKYFQNERPLHAFRARGFEFGRSFFGSMGGVVFSYVAGAKRTQPHGPYAIAGYSYGGVVAFEVAKPWPMGDEVKFPPKKGLINIPPHIADRTHEIDWTGCTLHLSYFLGLVSKQDVNDLAPALNIDAVWELSPEHLLELQLTFERLDRSVGIAGSLPECGKMYVPSGVDRLSPSILIVPTYLISASLDVFYAIPLRFDRSEPSYTDVPGHHDTLMDFDHVPGFQRIFRKRLEARGL
ncbi:Alpha/Beta hydrolase protein [Boletus coccyginus]|nr:Alpha/Beta hydrolase protein [Boletus coccyginus]